MLKNFISSGNISVTGDCQEKKINGWVWTIITILVTVGVVAVYKCLPSIVTETFLTLSTSSLFYDSIYKGVEKFIVNKLSAGDKRPDIPLR